MKHIQYSGLVPRRSTYIQAVEYPREDHVSKPQHDRDFQRAVASNTDRSGDAGELVSTAVGGLYPSGNSGSRIGARDGSTENMVVRSSSSLEASSGIIVLSARSTIRIGQAATSIVRDKARGPLHDSSGTNRSNRALDTAPRLLLV